MVLFHFLFTVLSRPVCSPPSPHLFLLSLIPRLFFVFVCLVELSEVLILAGQWNILFLSVFFFFAFLIFSLSNLTKSSNNGKWLKTFMDSFCLGHLKKYIYFPHKVKTAKWYCCYWLWWPVRFDFTSEFLNSFKWLWTISLLVNDRGCCFGQPRLPK